MPHVYLPEGLPGILGPMVAYPETEKHLNGLADALLRADVPFARGGQTTLNLSAVGSGGPLFIGLAPDTAVQRYLDGDVG